MPVVPPPPGAGRGTGTGRGGGVIPRPPGATGIPRGPVVPKPPTGANRPSKKERRARKIIKSLDSSPGIGEQIVGAVRSVPSGLAGIAKSGAEELVVNPTVGVYEGVKEGDIGKVLYNSPLGTGTRAGLGLAKGAISGEENADNPLTSAFGASFRRTYEDVRDPERFIDAYNRGEIVGKLLEDVGNVALAGGAAAKVLNLTSKGAVARAATARSTAEAAESAIPKVTKIAEDAAKQASEHQQAAQSVRSQFEAIQGPKPMRHLWSERLKATEATARDAERAASEAQAALSEARTFAQTSAAHADRLVGEAGPTFTAYRIARAVERFGNQGAFVPAAPFSAISKGLSKATRAFVKANPALEAAIGRFDDALGIAESFRNRASRKAMAAQTAKIEAGQSRVSAQLGASIDKIDSVLGKDPVRWQAATAVHTGMAQAVIEQVDALGRHGPAAQAAAVERLGDIARGLGYEPSAIGMALDIVRGTADPALIRQVEVANAVWDAEVRPWTESSLRDEGQGLKRSQTEDQAGFTEWNISGEGLPPGVTEDLVARGLARNERLVGEAIPQAAKVARLAGKLGVPSETPVAAVQEILAQRAAETASVYGNVGRLRAVEAAARNEGRAIVARSAAERFSALRERIPPNVPDSVVHDLVDAVERYKGAADQLDAVVESGVTVGPEIITRVRELRAEVENLARAELASFSDNLPTQLPFIPADLAPDFYAPLYDRIGEGVGSGRAASDRATVLDRMEQMRSKLRGRARYTTTDAELFARAYNQAYDKLPAHVRTAFAPLEGAEIQALYERHLAGGLPPEVGGLDTLAMEYGANRADLGADVTGEGAIAAMLDDYAARARIEGFLKRAGRKAWGPEALTLLQGARSVPELAALLDNPSTAAAIGAHRLTDAGQAIAERQAAVAAEPVPMPDAGALNDVLDTAPEDMTLEAGIEAAFGDDINDPNSGSSRFFEAWSRAGSPDLNVAIDDVLAGRTPEWAQTAPEPAAVGASAGLDTLRAQEQARSEIGSLVGESGGQPLDPALRQEAAMLVARAKRAERLAAEAPEARQALVSSLAESGTKRGVRQGRTVEKYAKALDQLQLTRKQIAATPEWMQRELERLYKDIMNAPARARPSLKVGRDFTQSLVRWRDEINSGLAEGAGGLDPTMVGVLDQVIEMGIKDVRDIWGAKVAGPGGELTPAPARFEPQYRPGGQPLQLEGSIGPSRRPAVRRLRAMVAHEERKKTLQLLPRSADETRLVIRERIRTHTENQAARMVAQMYGKRADAILTPDERVGREGDPLTPSQVAVVMGEKGYIPWDPESMTQRVKPSETGAHTLWLPEPIMKSVESYFGEAGAMERFFRRYYDRPMTGWRAAVLALRPAWHVNNVTGNAFMAMIGTGMGPLEYARRFRQARALLSLPEARLAETLPPGMAREAAMNRAQRRAANPARLAKIRRRVATIEPDTLEGLGGADLATAPPRLNEGGAGASLSTNAELGDLLENPGRLKRFINRSYEINGAIDDASRLAVFLDQHAKLAEADISALQAQHPELVGLTRAQVRTEGALRISLKVAGDFLRMTPLERQLFRRVVPFYAWLRHITGLAFHLSVHHPVRVVWTMHLAEMFGTPSEFGLVNALALSPNGVLQLPSINPFQDVASVDPAEAGFNLSPAIKFGAGLAGIDLNRRTAFQRPPGQPGGYGGPPVNPMLIPGRPRELLNLIGQQFPQTRVVRGVTDTVTEGAPVMRYPLGQIRREPITAGHGTIKSGEPIFGPLARYLGVPYQRQPNKYERPDVLTKLKGPVRSKSRR